MIMKNLFRHWIRRLFAPGVLLREKYEAFRNLLEQDTQAHTLTAELQQIHHNQMKPDFAAIEEKCGRLSQCVSNVVAYLGSLCLACYPSLLDRYKKIDSDIRLALDRGTPSISPPFVIDLDRIDPESRLLAGGKAFNLAMLRRELGLPTPNGFVVTTNAFNYFLEENDIRREIDKRLAAVDTRSIASIEGASRSIRELMRWARIPEPVEAEISKALDALKGSAPDESGFCVRSSAVGEDGRSSYAGQYATALNVLQRDVMDAYQEVISSKYSSRAISYRIHSGDLDCQTPMAVLILQMVSAKASGVIYTHDPNDPREDDLAIHAVWGPGKGLVDGTAASELIRVDRLSPHRIKGRGNVERKANGLHFGEGNDGGVPANSDLSASADILPEEAVLKLADWALRLEQFFGCPQDIEWCMDGHGRLFVLQSRCLLIKDTSESGSSPRGQSIDNPVLISGGVAASGGAAVGIVYHAEQQPLLDSFPRGAVLVAKSPDPHYAMVMGKVGALVTDTGSAAGHLASVAREFGIPALFGTGTATRVLHPGRIVTVDANSATVYEGRAPDVVRYATERAPKMVETPFSSRLGKALQYISPLNLLDPDSGSFAPERCQTFNDILRFSHEKSIREMFSLGEVGGRRARGAKKLKAEIPIVVYLLDLGGGIEETYRSRHEIPSGAVRSVPFKSLWKGLADPEIRWDPATLHFDWKEFDRVSGGFVRQDSKQLGSYAVLSGDYLNFHIHFGYHFVVVDTLCSVDPQTNYIMLRFAGGGGRERARFLRVRFLEEVLSQFGFRVETRGDLLDARLAGLDQNRLGGSLEMVGRILGCSRLLDMVFENVTDVDETVERFLKGDYNLSPLGRA